jgi:hypothetical protein
MELNDISLLDTIANSNAGEKVYLVHPATSEPFTNADGSPMYITVLGQDSDKWRDNRHTILDRRNALKKSKVPAKEIDMTLINSLAAITSGWSITLGGQQPSCTPDNVRAVYVKYPWVMRQIQAYFDDESNFSKVSSPTS